jgi:hypothetical protein
MKRKPIRINWDDLEAAFENPNEELVYYLDLVNGHVVLEGEGEEREDQDETDDYGAESVAARPANQGDATRVYIAPLHEETKIEWLARFIEETDDLESTFVDRIRGALDSPEPQQLVLEALRDSPESKDRWYLYRAERLHELIDEWLDRNQVVTTDPPPWS